ncbi:ABC transporter permease [Herbaspirillum sp. RV1423]|uniref:MlaE family ABC transporter permease n=1 Tax=Herbaspirillum sp. RV1423 TaxID=1443993 RepID=UPI0009DF7C36|nr:ABC transporter permease [Herbaspirillum sp. RV1423]
MQGDWTLANYRRLQTQMTAMQTNGAELLSFSGLTALDTAGAALLVELIGVARAQQVAQHGDELTPAWRSLLATVAQALNQPETPTPAATSCTGDVLAGIGSTMLDLYANAIALLGFTGLCLQALATSLVHPSRWRLTAVVAQIEQTCLNAVPIVALLTFMVGAVVAFLGATVLADFGASIYTVDLVAFSFLREFGVLLTAILMAGRTASAFTAQIGSMKANEEIDAIRALGLDPMALLVLPRLLALLVAMPALTFIAMLSGMLGGALVCALSLQISPAMFLSLLQQDVSVRHFLVGIAKAPIFAFVIALIGCLEGFKVSGSAQSVGSHTTSSVVQSIFLVIVIDALAALFYMEMGW